MKAQDIVNQLAVLLPSLTDTLTNDIAISSLIRSGTTVTANTAAVHGLVIGKQANIVGAQTTIVISSLTRSGTTGTLITAANHDMTEGVSTNAEIAGAIEAEFNGTFTILTVPNRKTVTFTMADSGATTATGSPLLLNGASALQQYNGLKNITAVPTTTSFQYEIIDSTLNTPAAGTVIARTLPRISAAVSLDKLIDSYTKQAQGKLWAFVVLGDVFASKSRDILSDATSNLQRGNEYRQQLIQPFAVYIFFPTVTEIGARNSRDEAEDFRRPLLRALLGSKFDSGLFVGSQNPVQYIDDGFAAYSSSFYVHAFNFQQVADITFDDTIRYDLDVAFRDISLSMGTDVGTGEDSMVNNIDLDDIQL